MRSAVILSALGLAIGCAMTVPAGAATQPRQPVVKLSLPGGGIFTGTVTNGTADGRFSNGDVYQGGWKNGKPEGFGTMSYMLGGAYEGEWKNGRRHGKGIMTFAGSGRRAEVRFADDRRIDVPAEPAPAAPDPKRYSLAASEETTGSRLHKKMAYSPLPLDRGFDELTPEEQRLVRSYYPALDAGDNPPYPLRGGKELFVLLESMIWNLAISDEIQVYVALDKDANVTTVSTLSTIDQRQKDLIATAAGLLKYKPAQCGGQPCAGVVPFNLRLTIDL